jgi:DNA-binding response OmpR family regulator
MKTQPPEDKPLVLIVDDDPTVRLLACEVLEMNGFRTEVAKDGNETLAVISSLKPDVILLDFNIPGMNGIVICEALRRAGSRIPVIVLTGYIDEDLLKCAHDVGILDCIRKPPDWMALVERLRLILRAGQAAQETYETS